VPFVHPGRRSAGAAGFRPSFYRYRDHVKKLQTMAAGLLVAGIAVSGCGGAPSASPSRTTRPTAVSTYRGTALSWLTVKAEPWNHQLNTDQGRIDAASSSTKGVTPTVFFDRLRATCNRMIDDVGTAQDIVHAPSSSLDEAWTGMLAQTSAYATACLTLTRTGTSSALSAWNASLQSMDVASAKFNASVAAVRAGSSPTAG